MAKQNKRALISAEDFLLNDDEAGAVSNDHDVTAEAILGLAKSGKLRGSNDLKDFSAEMMGALLRKEVTVGASREMRQWAELIYSLIQTESLENGGKEVNFIGQLIQMSGVTMGHEKGPDKKEEKQAQLPVIDAVAHDVIPNEIDLGAEDLFTELIEEAV